MTQWSSFRCARCHRENEPGTANVNVFFFPPPKLRSTVAMGIDVAKFLEGMDVEQQVKRAVSTLKSDIGTYPHSHRHCWCSPLSLMCSESYRS